MGWPTEESAFTLLHRVRTGLEQPECETDNSHSSTSANKNSWSHTSTPKTTSWGGD
jgi:hypothetical protein